MNEAVIHYQQQLSTHNNDLIGSELPWMQQLRQSAMQHLVENGFPTTRDENWKYTNVNKLLTMPFVTSDAKIPAVPHNLSDYFIKDLDCYRLVFINGHLAQQYSDNLSDGTIITSLATAMTTHAHLLEQYITKICPSNEFNALNTSLMSDGAFIYIPQNTQLSKPIHILHISNTENDKQSSQLRHLIVADKSSECQVMESYHGSNELCYFTNVVTEINVGENAKVEHYKLQKEQLSAFHIAKIAVQQQKYSHFTSHAYSLGSKLARTELNIEQMAANISCELNGLYLTDGKQHTDTHATVNHAYPHGQSKQFYKGILNGRSRAVYNTCAVVQLDAQKSQTQQDNHNLLLSPHAEIDTKPELQIYADDVKCSHGATVGELDKDSLFYLQSRGIDIESAKSILTYGFAKEIIDLIPIKAIKNSIENHLIDYLPNKEISKEHTNHD